MGESRWIVPVWPVPAGIHALVTLRGQGERDGASRGPWRYFNQGAHVGDADDAVAANRRDLQNAWGMRAVFLQQVHGTGVLVLGGDGCGGSADAAASRERGVACTILVADCLPVLLATRTGAAVAAAHAGWRGLAAGVIERTVERLRRLSPDGGPGSMLAWLGPCIGPRAFEVGAEVRAQFLVADAAAGAHFTQAGDGKYLADLAALARQRLRGAGVTQIHGNDGTPAWCTVGNPRQFYSHRRDARQLGTTGRMAACIWRA